MIKIDDRELYTLLQKIIENQQEILQRITRIEITTLKTQQTIETIESEEEPDADEIDYETPIYNKNEKRPYIIQKPIEQDDRKIIKTNK